MMQRPDSPDGLREQIISLKAELDTAHRTLASFGYSVSHDLRAPLRTIDGFGQALEEDCAASLGDQGLGYLKHIRSATAFMDSMLDSVLELSRVYRAELHRETVDLTALATDIVKVLQHSEPGRIVDFQIQQGLTARADQALLRLCLEHLIGNAFKFTRKHGAAKIELTGERNDRTLFQVRDDGAGFDQTYAGKLFVPFQRLHSSSEFEGLGIGLSIVQNIVHRHGGRAWAESQVERGTTVFVELP